MAWTENGTGSSEDVKVSKLFMGRRSFSRFNCKETKYHGHFTALGKRTFFERNWECKLLFQFSRWSIWTSLENIKENWKWSKFIWLLIAANRCGFVNEGFYFVVHKIYLTFRIWLHLFSPIRISNVVESELSKRRDCIYRKKPSRSGWIHSFKRPGWRWRTSL